MRIKNRIFCYNSAMLIVIVGPTGSGKTDVALALAEFYRAPIINADAFQIYQEMDVGTAKVKKNRLISSFVVELVYISRRLYMIISLKRKKKTIFLTLKKWIMRHFITY